MAHFYGSIQGSRGYDEPMICECYEDFTTLSQAEANAQLIAAAPDMLEVLKTVRASLAFQHASEGNQFMRWQDEALYNNVCDAIRKATE